MALPPPPDTTLWDHDNFDDVDGQPLDLLEIYLTSRRDITRIEKLDSTRIQNPTPCTQLEPGTKMIVIYFYNDNNGFAWIDEKPYVTIC